MAAKFSFAPYISYNVPKTREAATDKQVNGIATDPRNQRVLQEYRLMFTVSVPSRNRTLQEVALDIATMQEDAAYKRVLQAVFATRAILQQCSMLTSTPKDVLIPEDLVASLTVAKGKATFTVVECYNIAGDVAEKLLLDEALPLLADRKTSKAYNPTLNVYVHSVEKNYSFGVGYRNNYDETPMRSVGISRSMTLGEYVAHRKLQLGM
jgi:hypothetical protein